MGLLDLLFGAGALGFAITAVVVAIRNGGLREEKSNLEIELSRREQRIHQLERSYQATSREFAEYRRRSIDQMRVLHDDIMQLEGDLAECSGPGDVRRRLQRLLSKATTRRALTSGDDQLHRERDDAEADET